MKTFSTDNVKIIKTLVLTAIIFSILKISFNYFQDSKSITNENNIYINDSSERPNTGEIDFK
jgi:hypothetical protein